MKIEPTTHFFNTFGSVGRRIALLLLVLSLLVVMALLFVQRNHSRTAWTAVPSLALNSPPLENGALPDGKQSLSPSRDDAVKNVLVIYSYDKNLSSNILIDQGIREILNTNTMVEVELYTEYMDLSRFSGDQYIQQLRELYQHKYSQREIDLVIVVMVPALDFILEYGAEIFLNTPVVFCTVDAHRLQARQLPENITGVLTEHSVRETLEVAQQLQPATQHVTVIFDESHPASVEMTEAVRDVLQEYEPQLNFDYIGNLTLEEWEVAAAQLPPQSIIFYVNLVSGTEGNVYTPQAALERIAATANVPIYGLFDTYLGHGIVGGYLVSYEAQGKKAADLAIRILTGEKPAALPITPDGTNVYMFDWKQLRRYNLAEGRLPADSIVIDRQPSLWDLYKGWIITAVLVIATESLLLVMLLVQRQIRQRAEKDLQKYRKHLEVLVDERTLTLQGEIAERRQAEITLRESEERFANILNSVEAIIYVSDMDTYEVLFVNEFARNIFGDVVGKICWQCLQQGQSGPCEFCTNPYLLKNNRPTGIYTWEFQNTLTNHWYHIQDQAITWSDGRLVRLEVATDITHVKEAEHQQQQLAALEERERIGRELHDDLGQVMGYMNVQAQAVRELLAQNKTAQADVALGQLIEAATHAHTDVRRYILGIRTNDEPVSIQTDVDGILADNFITVLQQYLDELHRHYPLTIDLSLPDEGADIMLAPEAGTQLLRIIQEALTNVRKHAGVDTVRVYLFADTDHVRVVIEDEGRGFDPESAPDTLDDESSPGHFGLKIMRERAESVGGTFQVKSSPNGGTKIIVQVPKVIPATTVGKFEQGLRVLLVDDHPMFLEGIHTLLSVRGLHVVGTARDGLEAQEKARALLPDLILMDVDMPRCNGVEATQRIKTELPDTRIVMLTVAADDDTLFAALKAGASGYLLKSLSSDEFYRLLKNMVRGEIVLAPELAARMLAEFQQGEITTSPAALQQEKFPELTAQQVEILDYAAQGLTYKEIATIVHLTERTIRYHMGQIVEHLQLKNRREAIAYARSKGLGQSTS